MSTLYQNTNIPRVNLAVPKLCQDLFFKHLNLNSVRHFKLALSLLFLGLFAISNKLCYDSLQICSHYLSLCNLPKHNLRSLIYMSITEHFKSMNKDTNYVQHNLSTISLSKTLSYLPLI